MTVVPSPLADRFLIAQLTDWPVSLLPIRPNRFMHSESQTMTNTARQTLMMSLKEIVFTERDAYQIAQIQINYVSQTSSLVECVSGRVCELFPLLRAAGVRSGQRVSILFRV